MMGGKIELNILSRMLLAISLVICLASCGNEENPVSQSSDIDTPAPSTPATFLAASVFEGNTVPDLTNMDFLAPRDDTLSARSNLDARLTFSETVFVTQIVDQSNDPYRPTLFPGFSIELITDGDDLIPLERNAILTWRTGNSFWDVVVGAGKVWREPEEAEWDRASLPVTLISRRVGQAKNCILQFLYTTTEISKAYVQCSQETSPVDFWQAADMQALVQVQFEDLMLDDKQAEIDRFRTERSKDVEIIPWDDLGSSADLVRDAFNVNLEDLAELSYGGIYYNGVLYQQDPPTRHGTYPYPRDMRHGVYSVTKTMSGALSMLYLAKRYGDEIFDAHITDYVAPLASSPGWEGVTFEHALNMVTGTYGEDNGNAIEPFINARTALQGIQRIASLGDASPAPGDGFNYASTNTFVLSYAMQEYVEAREGPDVYFWDLVQENVLDLIGVYDFPIQKTLEDDGSDGIPTLGWGAFPTADDAVKIARLMQDGGEHEGVQLLHRQRTLDATGQSSWYGYTVDQNVSYRHSFWSVPVNVGGCEVSHHFMQGHGGNFVSLLSTGAIIVRFSDHLDYDGSALVRAANQIVPCY